MIYKKQNKIRNSFTIGYSKSLVIIFTLALLVFLISQIFVSQYQALAAAGITKQINFQGKLTDNGDIPVINGNYNIRFRIYADGDSACTNGTLKWTEEYKQANRIAVDNGLFNTLLGGLSTLSLDFNTNDYWLAVSVGGTGDVENPTYEDLAPCQRVAAAGYAYNSDTVDGIHASSTATANYLLPLDANLDFSLPDDSKVSFRDAGVFIHSTLDGKMLISADGTGADDITLSGTVTGDDTWTTTALSVSNQGTVRFYEATGGGSNYVGIQANVALDGDTTYTLPTAYPTTSGYVLSSTDAGVMSWIANGGDYWTANGNDIYKNNSGNVGIGDSSPDTLLDLLSSAGGNTQITISDTAAGDSDPQIGLQLVEGTNNFTLGVDDSAAGDPFVIGTTALGTGNMFTLDSRSTTSGVSTMLISAIAPTIASAAGTEYTTLTVTPPTITLTGTTQVTSQMDSILFNAPTITDSSGVIVDNATTLTIAGAPAAGGSVTITNPWALLVDSGNSVFDNNVVIGGSTSRTETMSNAGFALDGDDLFIAGTLGVEGNIYYDGGLIAGSSTIYGDGSITQESGETLTIGTTSADLTLQSTTSGNVVLNSAGNAIITSSNFNVTSAGVVTLTGDLALSGDASEGITGGGLVDCDLATQKLQWDETTHKFSCGTDDRGSTTVVTKSADQAAAQSLTVMQNVTEQVFAMAANKTYSIEAYIPVDNSDSLADLKYTVTVPSGATLNIFATTYKSSSLIDNCNITSSGQVCSSTVNSAVNMIILRGFVANSSNAGNFQVQFAQNTSAAVSFPVIKKGANLSYTPTSGADLAEIYFTNDLSIGAGDIVSIDPNLATGVMKSAMASDENLLGIISTKPGLLLAEEEMGSGMPVPITLSGRVPVKVNLENGPIKIGDYITSSSTAGAGMKANQGDPTVGIALSSYDGTQSMAKISVLVSRNNGANFANSSKGKFDSIELTVLTSPTNADLVIEPGSGRAIIKGSLRVTTKITTKDIEIMGHISGNHDTRGKITIPAGATQAVFTFDTPYLLDPYVVISPNSDPKVNYWVDVKKENITIHLSQPITNDIQFTWFAEQ